MVFDPATGSIVLFGGQGPTTDLADTWTWTGSTWAQLSSNASPAARAYSAVAVDPATGGMVMFGGLSGSDTLGDMWSWGLRAPVLTTWSKSISPIGARPGDAIAYDEANGEVVVSGGGEAGHRLKDTWIWQGEWNKPSLVTSPSIRDYAAMAFDPATGNVVLVGGQNSTGALADTWTWNGTTWTQLSPTVSSPGRAVAAMAFDPATGTMVLFGGIAPPASFKDT
jgi:hypothetical protein